jgi:multiple sugar transport system substrate-binding protein
MSLKIRRLSLLASLLVIASMLLTACPAPVAVPAAPAEPAGEASWWKTAAEAAGCTGVTLRGVTESTAASLYAADTLAKAFEAESGIKVELETTSWNEMYDKAIKDMEAQTGIYDFVYIEQDIIYAYLANEYLQNITQALKDNPELASPDFDASKFTSFADFFKDANGDLYGVPMEAFIKFNLYRKDLFEDPAVQEAFKTAYGRDLAPAKNFQEYRDNAEFFTKWGQDNGLELWGTTVQAASGHSSSFYELFESILPAAGVYNWGISPEFKASVANGGQMNSDRAKEAFQFWVDMLQYAPPEASSSTWDEVGASFAAGRAAQGWVYGENTGWIARDPERSKVVGKVGVALPPLWDDQVMADAEADTGYIGYYDGGAFGLPVSSKNPKCAILWGEFIAQEALQPEWSVNAARIVMESTYDDPLITAADAEMDGYFTKMKEYGPLFGGAPPYPFHAQVSNVIMPFVWKALAGEMSVSDALDQAAEAAEAELVNLGYAK